MTLQELGIDKSWTLFIDRDGVINRKRENDYVKAWEEFEFLSGAKKALAQLANCVGKIIVVTNQKGIAKGLYTEADFADITMNMLDEVDDAGGRIDWVFYCPHLGTEMICNCRKPKPGMAYQAKAKFPGINFDKSIVIGDAQSDMEFGRFLEMITVRIAPQTDLSANFTSSSLEEFANELKK